MLPKIIANANQKINLTKPIMDFALLILSYINCTIFTPNIS